VLDKFVGRVRLLVGVDIEPPAQRSSAAPVQADLSHLPFGNGVFDVVLCYNVVEHLADPAQTLREFARLLAPGGALILRTPNATAPMTVLSRLTPLSVRRRVKGRLGVEAEQVFATYYRSNTRGTLHRLLSAAGLECEALDTVDQTHDYLYFTRLTYALGLAYCRMVSLPGMGWARNSIIGVYTKTEGATKADQGKGELTQ
jgi:SAM-dependent methyltransferase